MIGGKAQNRRAPALSRRKMTIGPTLMSHVQGYLKIIYSPAELINKRYVRVFHKLVQVATIFVARFMKNSPSPTPSWQVLGGMKKLVYTWVVNEWWESTCVWAIAHQRPLHLKASNYLMKIDAYKKTADLCTNYANTRPHPSEYQHSINTPKKIAY